MTLVTFREGDIVVRTSTDDRPETRMTVVRQMNVREVIVRATNSRSKKTEWVEQVAELRRVA